MQRRYIKRLIIGTLVVLTCMVCFIKIMFQEDIKSDSSQSGLMETTLQGGMAGNSFDTIYTAGVSTDDTTNEMKKDMVLAITDLDESLNFTYKNQGKDRKVVMTVYYDYKQVPFKVNQDEEYTLQHQFDVKDGELIEGEFYLDPTIDISGCSHKLMVSFISGYDIHQSDLESELENSYGLGVVYDTTNTNVDDENTKCEMKSIEAVSPARVFSNFYSEPLIINMDMQNKVQEKQRILLPDALLQVKPNEEVKLMYNISNQDYESALLLLTVGFEQVDINSNKYEVVQLDQENSVVNGPLSFIAPKEPGKYEVIAYLVYDPWKTMKSTDLSNSSVGLSYRFTLEVVE